MKCDGQTPNFMTFGTIFSSGEWEINLGKNCGK